MASILSVLIISDDIQGEMIHIFILVNRKGDVLGGMTYMRKIVGRNRIG